MLEIQRCFKYLKLLTRGVGRRSVPWVRSWSPCRPCCWKRSRIPRVEKLIEHQESFSSTKWVGRELHSCESSSGSNHKWGFLCSLTVLAKFGTPCISPVSYNHFVIATVFQVEGSEIQDQVVVWICPYCPSTFLTARVVIWKSRGIDHACVVSFESRWTNCQVKWRHWFFCPRVRVCVCACVCARVTCRCLCICMCICVYNCVCIVHVHVCAYANVNVWEGVRIGIRLCVYAPMCRRISMPLCMCCACAHVHMCIYVCGVCLCASLRASVCEWALVYLCVCVCVCVCVCLSAYLNVVHVLAHVRLTHII